VRSKHLKLLLRQLRRMQFGRKSEKLERLRAKHPQYDAEMLADDAPVLRSTPVRITAWGKDLEPQRPSRDSHQE
jgi:hypothetical protein